VKRPDTFTLLGWILVFLMLAFLSLVVIPEAEAQEARLLLEIESESLRIFEYETPRMLCHVSIVDVKMIGSQASVTCVRKYVPKYTAPKPFHVRPSETDSPD